MGRFLCTREVFHAHIKNELGKSDCIWQGEQQSCACQIGVHYVVERERETHETLSCRV